MFHTTQQLPAHPSRLWGTRAHRVATTGAGAGSEPPAGAAPSGTPRAQAGPLGHCTAPWREAHSLASWRMCRNEGNGLPDPFLGVWGPHTHPPRVPALTLAGGSQTHAQGPWPACDRFPRPLSTQPSRGPSPGTHLGLHTRSLRVSVGDLRGSGGMGPTHGHSFPWGIL